MMEINWLEWFGYLGSLVILISLTMSSIIKLRVINLIGCLLFAVFAYFIDSVPTIFMNLGIALINAYFLWKMYRCKEQFKLFLTSKDSEHFQYFLSLNQQEIEKQIELTELEKANTHFYLLRDNNIAGILAGVKENDGTFKVMLDYVTPRYRDFKLGSYYYNSNPEFIMERGIHTLKAVSKDDAHSFYLEKMGFEKQGEDETQTYIKRL